MDPNAPSCSRGLFFLSHDERATAELGRAIGAQLWPGSVIGFFGELGAGKTCFARGVAQGLGVDSGVASPSFTLLLEYQGRLPIYHLDAWMSARGEAFLSSGGADWLRGDGVSMVEWAQRVERYLPRPYLAVHLQHRVASERGIGLSIAQREGPAGSEGPCTQAARQAWERVLASLPAIQGLTAVPAPAPTPASGCGPNSMPVEGSV